MLPQDLQNKIKTIYADNSFMKLCGIKINSLEAGEAKVGLLLDDKLHTNTNHMVHGGLLMTMMDTATGLAGCTVGKKLVTVSMNVNFIKSIAPETEIEATASVEQQDNDFYHLKMQVVNKKTNTLLATAQSVMLAIANI